jgi:hypothetical protein
VKLAFHEKGARIEVPPWMNRSDPSPEFTKDPRRACFVDALDGLDLSDRALALVNVLAILPSL